MRDRHEAQASGRQPANPEWGRLPRRPESHAASSPADTLKNRFKATSGVSPAVASKLGRASGGQLLQALPQTLRQVARGSPLDGRVIGDAIKLLNELLEADGRIDHDRLHIGEVLQMRVEIDGVEDAEHFLANFGALPCGPADHLFIKNATVDPAQEHEIGDGGHIDAGRQKIDCDSNLRIGVVTE